jgi:4-hydroxy-tetrahydrodipicolinate reductase
LAKDLGEILDIDKKLSIVVSDDVDSVMRKACCDVVIHATGSYLKDVYPQIAPVARYGVNVISTCEELSYPYLSEPELAKKLEALGVKYAMSFLGTGINPGFLMDTLPITMTGPCLDVKCVKVTRMMNSGRRRTSYQKKVGTTLTKEEFGEKMGKQITGHVGLDSSIAMIADSLGWKLDDIVEVAPEPVIAEETTETNYATIVKGCVAGLRSVAYGIIAGQKVIELEFVSHARVEEEYDLIKTHVLKV